MIRLPLPCLVVLVGPSGSGKSHWALVGEGEYDQRAGTDAFDALDLVLAQTAMLRLIDVEDAGALDRFAPVIDAFRVGP